MRRMLSPETGHNIYLYLFVNMHGHASTVLECACCTFLRLSDQRNHRCYGAPHENQCPLTRPGRYSPEARPRLSGWFTRQRPRPKEQSLFGVPARSPPCAVERAPTAPDHRSVPTVSTMPHFPTATRKGVWDADQLAHHQGARSIWCLTIEPPKTYFLNGNRCLK